MTKTEALRIEYNKEIPFDNLNRISYVHWLERKLIKYQEQVAISLDRNRKCPYCNSVDVSDIEGVVWCSGCDSTY